MPPIHLGRVVVTPGVLLALGASAGTTIHRLLDRFAACEWADASPEAVADNTTALSTGDEIIATYGATAHDGRPLRIAISRAHLGSQTGLVTTVYLEEER